MQLGPSDLALGLGIKETYNFDNPQVKRVRFERLFKRPKKRHSADGSHRASQSGAGELRWRKMESG